MSRQLFTPDEILNITRGFRLTKGARSRLDRYDVPAASFCVDSREAREDSVFFALAGERTDGHRFINDAFESGALAAVAEVRSLSRDPSWFLQLAPWLKRKIIFVEDSLQSLQETARSWLARFPDITLIGVTGSCGKTTTKELIASVLSQEHETVKSPGNRNSVIGLPLSLFEIRQNHRYGVFEMGVSLPGEMEQLAALVPPEIGIVTNIGTAHIGNFESSEQIAREKGMMFSRGARQAYIQEDCPWKEQLVSGRNLDMRLFGPGHAPGIEGYTNRGLLGWEIAYKGKTISYPLIGYHNLVNAFCAVTLAEDLGISEEHIVRGLEQVSSLAGRGRIVHAGAVTVIEDCYNANTDSMKAMLSYIHTLNWKHGRVGLILGAMKELGKRSGELHRELGRQIAGTACDAVFLFGEEMEETKQALEQEYHHIEVCCTADVRELQHRTMKYFRPGDLALIKGSRAMELERVVPRLCRAV